MSSWGTFSVVVSSAVRVSAFFASFFYKGSAHCVSVCPRLIGSHFHCTFHLLKSAHRLPFTDAKPPHSLHCVIVGACHQQYTNILFSHHPQLYAECINALTLQRQEPVRNGRVGESVLVLTWQMPSLLLALKRTIILPKAIWLGFVNTKQTRRFVWTTQSTPPPTNRPRCASHKTA